MQLIDVQLCATMIVHFLVGNVTAVDLTLVRKNPSMWLGVWQRCILSSKTRQNYTKTKTKGLKR